jgi:hypothetical protein
MRIVRASSACEDRNDDGILDMRLAVRSCDSIPRRVSACTVYELEYIRTIGRASPSVLSLF